MQTYRIADLDVNYAPQYPMLFSRSEKYKIPYDPEALQLEIPQDWVDDVRENNPHLDDGTIEYMLTGSAYYRALLPLGGMMLHASAVVVDDAAYLFSAPSGTGKSTHTSLWLQKFGDRAYILNDDKPALRVYDDGVFAFGTPFSGKFDISVNKRIPLRGIAFIERSESNSITRKTEKEALYALLNQTIRPQEVEQYVDLLRVIRRILTQIPIYTLCCNMLPDAADVAYQAMKEGM